MSATITALAAQIDDLPEDWALVAVDANKRPIDAATGHLLTGWQLDDNTSRELLKHSGHVKAVGAIAGELSGGLLIIDFDGQRAGASLKRLTGFDEADLPPTVACTSGRPHRKKLFFSVVDQSLWGMIAGIGSRTKGLPDLEVLWSGRQGVVIGAHPMEGCGYKYLDGCSPNDLQVAEAPSWLIDPLICADGAAEDFVSPSGPLDELADILNHLEPKDFDEYPRWRDLGMACKMYDSGTDCKELFRDFSQRAPKYDAAMFEKQWKAWASFDEFVKRRPGKRPKTVASFIGEAMKNGYKPPKPSQQQADLEAVVKDQTKEKREKDARESPSIVNLLELLRHQTDISIRWNELKRCIVVGDGSIQEPTRAAVLLADQWKVNGGIKNAEICLTTVALENSFNPVREYFESLRGRDFPDVTDGELSECFGFDVSDQLSIDLMRVQLRACAGRGINPGGKMDTLLVLEGEQGNRKSSALEALSPDPSWYDETTRVNFDSRDSLSSLNSAFIYEFSEIEKILTTADVAQFKSWISRRNDKYCEKYEKVSKEHPRRCCLFGTTNQSSFLFDPTGARRFLICKNIKPCNTKLIVALRDAIWYQAMTQLENGFASFLSNDDPLFLQGQERAKNATIADPWETQLSAIVNLSLDQFFPSGFLLQSLGRSKDKLTVNDSKRLANCMKRLGWSKTRRRLDGHQNPVDGYCLIKQKQTDNSDLEDTF